MKQKVHLKNTIVISAFLILMFSFLTACRSKEAPGDYGELPFGLRYGDTWDQAKEKLKDYEIREEPAAAPAVSGLTIEEKLKKPLLRAELSFDTVRTELFETMEPPITVEEDKESYFYRIVLTLEPDETLWEQICTDLKKRYEPMNSDIQENGSQSFSVYVPLEEGLDAMDLENAEAVAEALLSVRDRGMEPQFFSHARTIVLERTEDAFVLTYRTGAENYARYLDKLLSAQK